MKPQRIAIIGAGNVRCMPPVLASLAAFFGERPMDVALYDPDEERLDLFDRLARTFFAFNRSTHGLESTIEPDEAIAHASHVIVQIDLHSASRALKMKRTGGDSIYNRALPLLLANCPEDAHVLSLLPASIVLPVADYRQMDWPPELSDLELGAIPHQVLRWIRGEDYAFELFEHYHETPLRRWLNDPLSIPFSNESG